MAMTNSDLLERIRAALADKFHLELPDDTDSATFERDLLAALHGHPGFELVDDEGGQQNDYGGLDDEDDDEYDDDDQLGYAADGSDIDGPRMDAARQLSFCRPKARLRKITTSRKLSAGRKPTAPRRTAALAGVTQKRGKEIAREACKSAGLL